MAGFRLSGGYGLESPTIGWRPLETALRNTSTVPRRFRAREYELRLGPRRARFWAAAGLEPIGLHECRDTAASARIAAGVNAKAVTTFTGYADIATTFDLYGCLMPRGEDDALALADAYYEPELVRSRDVARGPPRQP